MQNNQKELILLKDLGMKKPNEDDKRSRHYAIYKCFCGKEFETRIDGVKNGKTKSCGCVRKEKLSLIFKEKYTIHGLRNHKLYKIYSNIIERCEREKHKSYKDYGGRGITICKDWRENFINFYNWATNNGYKSGLSIDRINNDGNYEPNNCRWTTKEVQARNTRKLISTNTSGYRGVSFHKKYKKWVATIAVSCINKYLGSFNTAIEAAKAYDKYIIDNNLEHTRNL